MAAIVIYNGRMFTRCASIGSRYFELNIIWRKVMSDDAVGFYLVMLKVAAPGLIGGKTLNMTLGVNAPNGQIQGHGEVTQALPPPFGPTPIPHISGQILHTGFGKDTLLVHLTGEAIIPPPPDQPLTIREKFAASLAVSTAWEGIGTFTVGSQTISNCKVTPVKKK